MKILLKGYYGFGNFGDDLLLLVVYRTVREYFPEAVIEIFSNATINNKNFHLNAEYHQYIRKLLDAPDVKIVDWTHKAYYDIVIDGGGGVYFDHNKAGVLKHFANKIVSFLSPQRFFMLEQFLRKLIGKSSYLTFNRRYAIGINIGPFDTSSSQFIPLYSLLGAVDAFLVRDMESIEYLEHFGHKGEYTQIADMVFCTTYLPECKAFQMIERKELKTIGIVLMNWQDKGKGYLSELERFAKYAEVQGYECRFFAFSQLDDNLLQDGFEYTIEYWKPNEMSVGEYLDKLSKADMIISMRFHGLVISTLLGIPSAGIGINSKIVDFTNQAKNCSRLVSSNAIERELPLVLRDIMAHYSEMTRSAKDLAGIYTSCEVTIRDFMQKILKQEG